MSIQILRRHVIIPPNMGVNVMTPRTSAATAAWWVVPGKTAVAAYCPKGAASLAASYSNLAQPGTYDAAPGTAPTFDAATGWTFNGSSQYLTTGIVPARAAGTLIARWSGAVASANGPVAVGSYQAGTCTVGLAGYWFSLSRVWCANGAEASEAPGIVAGVVAMAGVSLYRDGVYASDKEAGSETNTTAMFIGALNQSGSPLEWSYFNGSIQAVAYYSGILTAPQVATVSAAMAAL